MHEPLPQKNIPTIPLIAQGRKSQFPPIGQKGESIFQQNALKIKIPSPRKSSGRQAGNGPIEQSSVNIEVDEEPLIDIDEHIQHNNFVIPKTQPP